MRPGLLEGDRLLVHVTARIRDGDVVVVRDPDVASRLVVKRAVEVGDETVVLLGDNPDASRDSRKFGPVQRELVVGRAWWRYAPASRAGPLERGPRTGPRGHPPGAAGLR